MDSLVIEIALAATLAAAEPRPAPRTEEPAQQRIETDPKSRDQEIREQFLRKRQMPQGRRPEGFQRIWRY